MKRGFVLKCQLEFWLNFLLSTPIVVFERKNGLWNSLLRGPRISPENLRIFQNYLESVFISTACSIGTINVSVLILNCVRNVKQKTKKNFQLRLNWSKLLNCSILLYVWLCLYQGVIFTFYLLYYYIVYTLLFSF